MHPASQSEYIQPRYDRSEVWSGHAHLQSAFYSSLAERVDAGCHQLDYSNPSNYMAGLASISYGASQKKRQIGDGLKILVVLLNFGRPFDNVRCRSTLVHASTRVYGALQRSALNSGSEL